MPRKRYNLEAVVEFVREYLEGKDTRRAPFEEVVTATWRWGPCQGARSRDTATGAVMKALGSGKVRRVVVQPRPRRYELVLVDED